MHWKWMGCLLAVLMVGAALVPAPVGAQRLYNKTRDDQAKEALKHIDGLIDGTLFDKQLRNVARLSEQDIAMLFMDARRDMRASIGNFRTWKTLNEGVETVLGSYHEPPTYSPTQLDDADQEVKRKITAVKDELKKLRAAVKTLATDESQEDKPEDPLAVSLFDRLGQLEAFEKLADELTGRKDKAKANLEALKPLLSTLEALRELYVSYTDKLKTIDTTSKKLVALRIPLVQVALQRLQLEEEHLKTFADIEARRRADERDISLIYQGMRATMVSQGVATKPGDESTFTPSTSPITDDLTRLANEKKLNELATLINVLHQATALVARGSTPAELAAFRLKREEHLYSIRESALMTRAYEATISSGVKRLALYYEGGIKPGQVAALIHTAATVATPVAIFTK